MTHMRMPFTLDCCSIYEDAGPVHAGLTLASTMTALNLLLLH